MRRVFLGCPSEPSTKGIDPRTLFSSPVAEVLGTPDQDVHAVAGDEAHGQQAQRAHLQEGGARGGGREKGMSLQRTLWGGIGNAGIIQDSKNFLENWFASHV